MNIFNLLKTKFARGNSDPIYLPLKPTENRYCTFNAHEEYDSVMEGSGPFHLFERDVYREIVNERQKLYAWMVKYGAIFHAEMDGWFYCSEGREQDGPIFRSGINHQWCGSAEYPELSHVNEIVVKRLTPIETPTKGDVICIEGIGGLWFGYIQELINRMSINDLWKIKPVISTPKNYFGWITNEEVRKSMANNEIPEIAKVKEVSR